MKTKVIQLMAVFLLGTGAMFAQDMPESQVPSVIVNNFKKEFPKAYDVEWEKKGEQYNVEFEIGTGTDYEAWFTNSGKLIKYKQEITITNLPQAIKDAIHTNYPGFRIGEAKKYVENGVETYKVEIEKGSEELKLLFSKDGKIL
jgi:uncharacterized protein (DUF2249 family)